MTKRTQLIQSAVHASFPKPAGTSKPQQENRTIFDPDCKPHVTCDLLRTEGAREGGCFCENAAREEGGGKTRVRHRARATAWGFWAVARTEPSMLPFPLTSTQRLSCSSALVMPCFHKDFNIFTKQERCSSFWVETHPAPTWGGSAEAYWLSER